MSASGDEVPHLKPPTAWAVALAFGVRAIIHPEFEKLLLATLLSPWPWTSPPDAGAIERALFAAA